MAESKITLDDTGRAYSSLSAVEIRGSVALGSLEQADGIRALGAIVLEFDHYGRLAGTGILSGADSALRPALLDNAERTWPSAETARALRVTRGIRAQREITCANDALVPNRTTGGANTEAGAYRALAGRCSRQHSG